MKKGIIKIFTILLISITLLFKIPKLNAASGSISVKSNTSTVVIGNTVTVTVTISSSQALGSWEFTINYDSSKLKLTSGTSSIVEYGDGSRKSKSYTYKFKALAKGTSTVSVKAYNAYAWDESQMSLSAGSTRISAITQAELEASYSKNNNLSSLGVTGYDLSPEFDKDTTEYTVTVPSDVEKITIEGSVEDKTANAAGLGEFEVSEGENKFDIVVTAQNGSTKTYTLKVNVEDKNPIEVTIDGKKYLVVKRASALTAPATYEATTEMINGIEVPAFKSNITNYILVGLKSEDGTPNLYIYNESNNSYTLYTEIKTEGIVIFPKKATKTPKYYKITKVTINEVEVEAYQYDGVKDYYLIYGVNIETGEEGFYQYDMVNNTITRYNDKIINELTKKNENYLLIIIVLGVETLILLLVLLIMLTKRNKTKKVKVKKVTFDDFEKELEKDIKTEKVEEKTEDKKEENKEINKTKEINEDRIEDKAKNKKDKKQKNNKSF